ncbi:MAG: TetR/AcrR family transcriptional regulator [Pseudobutyrivibrio sp.]|uniref:TetR/AcrR family transcriptional regulator n=1 Tax=Pseudobutyrivibrio sp. TaxID=2014367 RepID=UPI0025FB9737|nr:TetR/AcrR family transcriptional regulator [Pseudobutyrivibrio sp.]MBE5903184.1 TetR/AcrR family transcriptional regulator [Pseudobutyrivibrio sp.]
MAIWVEEATENILKAAKAEFMECGFLNASLRTIAANAKTSPRSIYTRFSNKEELFDYFVKDYMQVFFRMFTDYLNGLSNKSREEQQDSRESASKHSLYEMTDYLYENFDAFYLLICCSEGTEFENFIEELASIEAKHTIKFINTISPKSKEIDYDFIHFMSRAFFDGYFEIVRHRYDKNKAMEYIDKLIKFNEAGWSQFL